MGVVRGQMGWEPTYPYNRKQYIFWGVIQNGKSINGKILILVTDNPFDFYDKNSK